MRAVLAILVLCSENLAIRVPLDWDGNSEVQNENQQTNEFQPSSHYISTSIHKKPIPIEYFEYTAKKPQVAADIAQFHGVKNPQNYYKAYQVRPYTGVKKPELGQHQILNENRPVFDQFQKFTDLNEPEQSFATPVNSNYEIFHPYKAEEPGLKEIYKDPVLVKVRNDIRDSQTRLQNYEEEAGKPNIEDSEYLESPEKTERKKFPHRNVPTQFEIHRPQRRPIYYKVQPKFNPKHVLNRKLRHPWKQNHAKVKPYHYRPLRNHLHRLRQHHASTFDDENNQYPQPPPAENYVEPTDGYDIYERGKEKFIKLRNNVDESINNAIKENRPTISQKLELQNNGGITETQVSDSEEDEFVPIKNYAQVRKTESIKHLPREAALADAESFDEIRNAPRLREAIKSTKAQTVYTEEGYEDAAYDHAGEQKHASENENHAGFLKEKEISGGKYKAPSIAAAYEDAGGHEHRDLLLHGEKWKNDDKEEEKENDSDDFSEDETADYIEEEVYKQVNGDRNKRDSTEDTESGEKNNLHDRRESESKKAEPQNEDVSAEASMQHDVIKRETTEEQDQTSSTKPFEKFKVPEINFNSTFLTEEDFKKIAKLKLKHKRDDIREKYPYYFKNLKTVHKNSPLRYAENLKLIPKKSDGGTEFYDSRSTFECPEVDDEVDALPEKLKREGHPDESNENDEDKPRKKGEADFDSVKGNSRLNGLGDKIDCFKAKYFGENPLDSPFFKEEIISNPEPITVPTLDTYKLKPKELSPQESQFRSIFKASDQLKDNSQSDVIALIEQLRNGQRNLQDSLVNTNQALRSSLIPQNLSIIGNSLSPILQQAVVYSDILGNIENSLQKSLPVSTYTKNKNAIASKLLDENSSNQKNITYDSLENKEHVTKTTLVLRKKRASPFVYEPYKIIRDVPESKKKTTTTSNVSPLIKQLQSSRVVDRVTNVDIKDQPVKRNVVTRTYKDIGKQDRESYNKRVKSPGPIIVDVGVEERRGEPKYEIIRPANHKSKYTPVDNKTAISVEDYEAKTNKTLLINKYKLKANEESTVTPQKLPEQRLKTSKPTVRSYFDITSFMPKAGDTQTPSASNTVRKVISTSTSAPQIKKNRQADTKRVHKNDENQEDYEEYDDEEEEITTTTTLKPHFIRRRPSSTTTTALPEEEEEEEEVQELPRLRLITRFRSTTAKPKKQKGTEIPRVSKKHESDDSSPQYREKKRKSTKSTLVTDSKSYGDDDDDMMKDIVDAMIGVQHDTDEYTPMYERENRQKPSRENDEEEDDEDNEEDDDSYEEFDNDHDDDDEESEEDEEEVEIDHVVTTPEPSRRTLIRTTEAPPTTTEARSAKLEIRPKVTKKTIEIHKELPINNSSPHVTQFKQDIKEVEIIKEIPSKSPIKAPPKKPLKNIEALELYKDDNLAKEVNKLGAVEIFKANLDLRGGPKHGGNYRRASLAELREDVNPTSTSPLHNLKFPKDAETSQSETKKQIELNVPRRGNHSRNDRRNAKLELQEPTERSSTRFMHGGNLKPLSEKGRRGGSGRTAKLIELDEDNDEDDDSASSMHGGNFKSYGISKSNSGRPTHGGNYRSEKIVQTANNDDDTLKRDKTVSTTNARNNAAVLLNSFAQAVPILTTTPAYILDPSKRMYYYVEP